MMLGRMHAILCLGIACLFATGCGNAIGGTGLDIGLTGASDTSVFDILPVKYIAKACTADAQCDAYDDGNKCNGVWYCDKGFCHSKANSAVTCNDGYDTACNTNKCNPTTGVCDHVVAPEGGACDDGIACTVGETCRGGVCGGGAAKACTSGLACNEATGGCSPASGSCGSPFVISALPFAIDAETVQLTQSSDTCGVNAGNDPGFITGKTAVGEGYSHFYKVTAGAPFSALLIDSPDANLWDMYKSSGYDPVYGTGVHYYYCDPGSVFDPMPPPCPYDCPAAPYTKCAVPATLSQELHGAKSLVVSRRVSSAYPSYTLQVTCDANACGDAQCGFDPCGKLCGTCPTGSLCDQDRKCRPQGESCENPIPISAFPAELDGTVGNQSNYEFTTFCSATPAAQGFASEGDTTIFSIHTKVAGSYRFTARTTSSHGSAGLLWLADRCNGLDCLDAANALQQGNTQATSVSLATTLQANQEYRLFFAGSGDYHLSACQRACDGKVCGPDGCGGTCGDCAGSACAPDQKSCCSDLCGDKICGQTVCGTSCGSCPGTKVCGADQKSCVIAPGDTCATAFPVGALPFTGNAKTTDGEGDYSAVLCQFGGLWGKGSRDQVWAFTPQAAGDYAIGVTGDFDAAVYVVDTCAAVAPKCTPGTMQPASSPANPFIVTLPAGKVAYIVVDGIDNATPGASGKYSLTVTKQGGPVCGNGTCEAGENSSNCLQDCPIAPDAGSTDVAASDTTSGPTSLDFAAWPLPADAPPAYNYALDANTVTDQTTGLTWQRNVATPADRTTAVAYCDALSLGGQSDWRLPTRIELLSLIDTSNVFPVLSTTIFPGTPTGNASTSVWFWSVSTDVQDPGYGWGVDFALGLMKATAFTTTAQVRCVRAGKVPPSQHYTVNNTTVVDNATGLMWQKVPGTTAATQAAAITQCQTLSLGGFATGWRLPGKKELESLVDVSTFGPAVAANVFQVGNMTAFWSNAAPATYTGNAYQVFMGYGGTQLLPTDSASTAVWCVRTM